MTNIAIIEHNSFYRESLKTALNQIDDFNVVFDVDNIALIFDFSEQQNFQIILLDWIYYQTESVMKMLQLYPNTKILILSNYIESCFFYLFIPCIKYYLIIIMKSVILTIFFYIITIMTEII